MKKMRHKIKIIIAALVLILILILILLAFFDFGDLTKNIPTLSSKANQTANNPTILFSSPDYVKNIQAIAQASGARIALSKIMADVNINENGLNGNDVNGILRFHKLVSQLIYHIGYVDRETHYFRNKLNRVPKSLKDLISINNSRPVNKRWILLSISNSIYHIQGIGGEYNLKFISHDGYYEAVYNKKGVLLDEKNDPINMGSYNYSPGIPGSQAHKKYDMVPYLEWGNSPDSPQKDRIAINAGTLAAYINYQANAAKVYIYRQNLFGMQQGRVQ